MSRNCIGLGDSSVPYIVVASRVMPVSAAIPATTGAARLVPPTWNHPVSPWNFVVVNTPAPVAGSATAARSGVARCPGHRSDAIGSAACSGDASSYLLHPPPARFHARSDTTPALVLNVVPPTDTTSGKDHGQAAFAPPFSPAENKTV